MALPCPQLTWTNTVPWTCQTCGNEFTEAFCGRLRHMCLECGSLFVENASPMWYSRQHQEKRGYHTICETVMGKLIRCTSTGLKPAFDDVIYMGRLFMLHETVENGSEPSACSRMASPPLE